MTLYDAPVSTLGGGAADLHEYEGKAALVVNVASKCGLTPQYEGLVKLHKSYRYRGFVVLGFPCNQFGGQEPGTDEEIETFCSTTYGVDFPLFAKIDVNGEGQHPLYAELTQVPDQADGHTGDVRWNFEKFLIAADGTVTRFSPMVTPEDPALVEAIEKALP